MTNGRRWTVRDRDGNTIYMTDERWEHIIEPLNHPEMAFCEVELTKGNDTNRTAQARCA